MSQEMQLDSRSWKRNINKILPQEPPEEHSPADTLILGHGVPLRDTLSSSFTMFTKCWLCGQY